MSTQTPENAGENVDDKILWNKKEENFFINLMVTEVRRGNLNSTIFHDRIWTQLDQQMCLAFGKVYIVKRLKEKFRRLKIKFKIFKDLITSTGMGWDEQNTTVVGSEDNWQNAIAKNKEAKQFRKKGCEHYQLLQEIFNMSTATGHFARTSTQEPLSSDQEQEVEEVYLHGPNFENPLGSQPTHAGVEEGGNGTSSQPPKKKMNKGKTKSQSDSSAMEEAWMAIRDTQMSKRTLLEKASGPSKSEECVDILESMEGVSDDMYLAAIEVFRHDDKMPALFLRMSETRRRAWLAKLVP